MKNPRWWTLLTVPLFAFAAPLAAAETCKLYFLGGQSNMDGYGFTEELAASSRGSVDDVMIFRGKPVLDDNPEGGIGVWAPLGPGFGTGFQTDGKNNALSDRFGPELSFGRRIAALNPGQCIALVKYAFGGTGLMVGVGYGNWSPDYDGGQGINQYDSALATLRNAEQGDLILEPAGILWMQGEADAFDNEAAAIAYRANLERLMDLLRAAMRADGLPVVIGKITDSGMADDGTVMDYIGIVQQAQAAYVEQDGCAALVTDTEDFGYLDDAWHYDSAGYLAMGAAFADAVHGLEQHCGNAAKGDDK